MEYMYTTERSTNKSIFKYTIRAVLTLAIISASAMSHAQRTASIGSAQQFSADAGYVRMVRIDDNHVLALYKDGGTSSADDLYARVGQVDTSSQSITWGTAALVEAEVNLRATALELTSSSVIVAYEREVNSNDTGVARVLSINTSSNAISSVGDPHAFYNGTIDAAFSHASISMAKLTDSKFALCFAEGTTDNGEVVIGNVSSSAISFGSVQEWSTGDVHNFWMDTLSSSKIVISFENDGASSDPGKVIIGNVSGTTVSYGSESTFYDNSSSGSVSYTALKSIDSSTFVVAYTRDSDNEGYAVVGTVSGTSASFGTHYQMNMDVSSAGPRDITIAYAYGPTNSDNEVAIAFNTGGSDSAFVIIAEVSGTALAFDTALILDSEADDSWITNLNQNALVVGYVNDGSSDQGEAKVIMLTPELASACTLTASVATTTNISCNGGSDGALTASGSGGTGSLTYAWSTGAITASITGLVANAYTVTVTDANACTATASATLTAPTAISASVSVGSNVSCNGGSDGQASVSASGGTGGLTYAWSNAATSSSITGLTAGTYTVTVTDANGCTNTASGAVTEPTALVLNSSVNTNISCNGQTDGSLCASASGGTPAYSYLWSNAAVGACITGLAAGTYSVTVVDANGCTATSSNSLSEPTAISVSITVDSNESCGAGGDGGLTASASGGSGPYSYAWSNTDTTASITSLSAGTYTVTVTDNNACTTTASNTVSGGGSISVSLAATNVSCNGNSDGALSATPSGGTGAYTYAWSNSATTASISGLTAGSYTVTVSDAIGCSIVSSSSVTEPSAIVVSTTSTNVACNGGNDGTASATVSGGTAAYSFLWSSGSLGATATGLSANTYTVTVTDANGCTSTAQVTITQPTAISISVSIDNMVSCEGGSDGVISASASGGSSPYAYLWSNAASTATVNGLTAGPYMVTVTDNNGCTAVASATITQPTELVTNIDANSQISCFGFADGELSANTLGGTPPYTYLWNNLETAATNSNLPAGVYFVETTDTNGCTRLDTMELIEPDELILQVNLAADVICNGDSDGALNAIITGGTLPYVLNWSDGGTNLFNTNLAAGTYTLTVTDNNGCMRDDSAAVSQPDAIVITAIVTDEQCEGDNSGSIDLSVSGGVSPYDYEWSNLVMNQDLLNVDEGTYAVTVTDFNDCVDTASYQVNLVSGLPAVNLGPDTIICNDSNITLFGGVFTSYQWSTGATTTSIQVGQGGVYSLTATNSAGCSAIDSIQVDTSDCLGVGEVVLQSAVRVYPNPSNGAITVESLNASRHIVSMQVINLAGQVEWEQRTELVTRLEVDLTRLAPGGYFITVVTSQGVQHVPIIIE